MVSVKPWRYNGRIRAFELGVDKSFALGVVNEAEGAWSFWLGPFYAFTSVP